MALDNINIQTFQVPTKQALLYVEADAVQYRRFTGTIGTLKEGALKALGIAKQQLPCLIYDADLLRIYNTNLLDISSVNIASNTKSTVAIIKNITDRKIDKHTYLNDQVHVKQAITQIDNRFDTLTKQQQVVTQLTDNKIVVPKKAIPVAIKTNKGTLYNIDFRYLEQTQDTYIIDPNVYLAYDNQAAFKGTWYVYYAGFFSKTIHEDRAGISIKNIQQPAIKLEHGKVVKYNLKADDVINIDTTHLVYNKVATMQLWLRMPQTVVSFSIPGVTWVQQPEFLEANSTYVVAIRWDGNRMLSSIEYTVQNNEQPSSLAQPTDNTIAYEVEQSNSIVTQNSFVTKDQLEQILSGMPLTVVQNTVIPVKNRNVVKHSIIQNQVITFNTDQLTQDKAVTMQLWLRMPQTVVSFTLQNVIWIKQPSFGNANTVYCLVLRWDGSRFIGNLAYTTEVI